MKPIFFEPLLLNPRDLRPYLLRREQTPHASNKSRQFFRKFRMLVSGVGKIQQLLAYHIIERGFEPRARFDVLSRIALLNPNLTRFAHAHCGLAIVWSCSDTQFSTEQSDEFSID
jgi:hypothetical protein